ncbi:MAG: FixH family protein [Pseudomonadota bacterium]
MKRITGWHVLGMFVFGFGIIITVNLTLAFNAVRTFPGLEVKNSYVASQSFDSDRAAQLALGWKADAWLEGGTLHLAIATKNGPVFPEIEHAVFGRATSVAADQTPVFTITKGQYVAPVAVGEGNWNLRVRLRAANGTLFQQRIIVRDRS